MNIPAAVIRPWSEARSMAELILILGKDTETPLSGSPSEILRKALSVGAASENQVADFATGVSMLWARLHLPGADGSPANPEALAWLKEMLKTVAPAAICWKKQEPFVAQLAKLDAKKLLPSWYQATVEAKGIDFLIQKFSELPVKTRTQAEEIIAKTEGAMEKLALQVVDNLRKSKAGADCYLWLWESPNIPGRDDILANTTVLMRVLSRPVSDNPSVQKSQIRLRKELLENDKFQKAVMRQGADEAVQAFIEFINHASFLDKSEQQSLLVKVVRHYPLAKRWIERKNEGSHRRPAAKVTSVRSYMQKSRELEEIISVKLPANTKAIEHARGYGDLRENAEFKAAKDEQRLLNARRTALEKAMQEVMPTDFAEVRLNGVVVPGCTVVLKDDSGAENSYHILGIWDNDPAGIIRSFDTPFGKSLLGRAQGEEVELPGGKKTLIVAVQPLDDAMKRWVKGE